MSAPTPRLLVMAAALAVGGAGCALLAPRLIDAFLANPGLNGAIIAVFAIGVISVFVQVWSLRREIAWIEGFGDGDRIDRPAPKLLAAMAAMLREKDGRFALSPAAQRSIIDGVAGRLEERREISRYLIGLLVFLGLLGTFWGLLDVVGAVAGVIGGLDLSSGGDGFLTLRDGLAAPISGMGVAFSSSLFGLAGSLALGFLELLSGQAQNRFFGELETWLSRRTRLAAGTSADDDDAPGFAYVAALLEQTAEALLRFEKNAQKSEDNAADLRRSVALMAERLAQSELRDRASPELDGMKRSLDALLARAEADPAPALLRAIEERLARNAIEASDARARAADALSADIKLLARTLAGGGDRTGG